MSLLRAFLSGTHRTALAIVAACIVLIAALWAVALERAGYEREQTVEATVRQNANLALSLEQHIGRTLQNVNQLLLFAAHEVGEHPGFVNIARWKNHRAIDASMVSFLGYADADGILAYGSSEFVPISVADREYFQHHRTPGGSELHVGKPFVGRVSGHHEIPVSRRVSGPEGEFRGVVVAGVDIRYFAAFYEQIDVGRHGSLNLVGRDGVIRARRGLGRAEAGQDLRNSTLLRAAAQKPSGDVMTLGQVDGIARFMSYRTLPEYDLVVAIGTSVDEMLAAVAAKRRDYLAGAALGSLLLAALGFALAFSLARQRRAAESKRRADAAYRASFDQAAVGICHATLEGTLLKVNARLCSMLGYSEPELVGRPFIDVVDPRDAGAVLEDKRRRLSGDLPEGSVEMEMRCIRKDGQVIWTSVAVKFVPGANGRPEYLLSLVQDVTDRKNAEIALKSSEERFRSLLELSSDFYWETDAEHRFVHRGGHGKTSAVAVFEQGRQFGLRRWEIPYLSPDEAGWQAHRADLDAHRPFRSFEISRLGSDGTERFQALSGDPLFDAAGAFLGYRGVGTDITERKRADRALFESRRRYRDLVDNTNDFIWELNEEMRFTLVSGNLHRLLGYSSKDILGKTPFDFMKPAEAERSREWMAERYAAGDRFAGTTHTVVDTAGRRRIWEESGTPIIAPNGKVQGYRGIARDVTDRHNAVRALKRSEQRFRSYFELGLVGMAITDPRRGLVEVNDRMCEILGYPREELLGKDWGALTHPEDLSIDLEQFGRMLSGAQDGYSMEKRFVRKDGRVVPTRISVRCVRKPDGTPDHFVGLADDLTERKRAEERLAATFNQAAVGMATSTLQLEVLEVNRRFAAMLGYRPEEMVGLRTADITHPDDVARSLEIRDRALVDPAADSSEFEKRYLHKDGSIVWAMIARALVKDANGRPDYFITVIRDITERKKVLEQAQKVEAQYRATFEKSAVGIAHVAADGCFIKVNTTYCAMLGYTEEELLARTFPQVTHPADREAHLEVVRRFAADTLATHYSDYEKRYVRKDGSELWVSLTISAVRDAAGKPEYYIAVASDITSRRLAQDALRESESRFRSLTELSSDFYWETDAEHRFTARGSAGKPSGVEVFQQGQQLGLRRWEIPHLSPDEAGWQEHMAILDAHQPFRNFEFSRQGGDGAPRHLSISGDPIFDASGAFTGYRGVGTDVTQAKLAQERLLHQAHYDALTDLPNRSLFLDRLAQGLAQAKRKRWTTGVLYLNLDRFEAVNGTYGHVGGDNVLRQVARRLSECVRAGDSVARIGADEFAVALCELQQAADASMVARKLVDALSSPFELNGDDIVLSASIGIATEPPDGDSGESLLRNAGAAMARAKETGRNNIQFYAAGMNERTSRHLKLQADLRRALERQEFILHFQPKAEVATGRISGFEALLRWQPAGKGLVSPADFIPLLEETGMIVPVGAWVIRAACSQIRAWRDAGLQAVPIAINVSAKQLTDELYDTVSAALAAHGVEPGALEMEITESDAMRDPDRVIAVLKRLRALGVAVSIDDFGTGYSSLGYLKRFPVQALKLDRSFVSGLPSDPDDVSIAKAVISMAHSLGLKVVAEGVETDAQRGFLAHNRCDEMQGYLLSRPLPAVQCAAYLETGANVSAAVMS